MSSSSSPNPLVDARPEHEETGHRRIRFVTLCQQLLALAVVVAVLTPAARTVTMEVRPSDPDKGAAVQDVELRAAEFASEVPAAPVTPVVDQYSLTAPTDPAAAATTPLDGTAVADADGGTTIVSDALPVTGYGTVGVTWAHGEKVPTGDIEIEVRTRSGDTWSGWTKADYHDDHGPDPSTREGRKARPGTDALLVGTVDAVQVRVDSQAVAPDDLKVAVIGAGTPTATKLEKPALDTAALDGASPAPASAPSAPASPAGAATSDGATSDNAGAIALKATVSTPKPMIFSRAQWGANEKIRDKGSLSYYEVHGGFVHHTVTANSYTRAQVPGIIRSIYSYHVKTKGWSDIGYNFLVDRFGRIWEGRAGGVDRPVVGAHTRGYNNYAFAAAALGNYDKAKPTSRMVRAYGALFAWKLSLHGVDAGSMSQQIGSRVFAAINGHRDAGRTACPGRYLYAKIPRIRALAATGQQGWSGRELANNYVGDATPDVLARRAADGRLVVLDVRANAQGGASVAAQLDSGSDVSWASQLLKAGDWDGDGLNDVVARRAADGAVLLLRGQAGGRFAAPVMLSDRIGNVTMLSAPGDVTGDGLPDLMGQKSGKMRIFPGKGAAGLGTSNQNLRPSWSAYPAVAGTDVVPAGRVNGDGAPDALVRNGASVRLYLGNGPGGWTASAPVDSSADGLDWLLPMGRVGSDSLSDFVGRVAATSELVLLTGNGRGWGTRTSLGVFPGYDLGA